MYMVKLKSLFLRLFLATELKLTAVLCLKYVIISRKMFSLFLIIFMCR